MPGAKIRRGLGGIVTLGDNCIIHDGVRILAYGGTIKIGDGTSINPNSILYGHGGVNIGRNVLVAAGTVIIPANHNIIANISIRGQGLNMKGITIGDDVWLGTGVSVLDGAVIEDGCVVGAGAVVTNQRLEAGCVFGGVPARKIGTRPVDLTVQSSELTIP